MTSCTSVYYTKRQRGRYYHIKSTLTITRAEGDKHTTKHARNHVCPHSTAQGCAPIVYWDRMQRASLREGPPVARWCVYRGPPAADTIGCRHREPMTAIARARPERPHSTGSAALRRPVWSYGSVHAAAACCRRAPRPNLRSVCHLPKCRRVAPPRATWSCQPPHRSRVFRGLMVSGEQQPSAPWSLRSHCTRWARLLRQEDERSARVHKAAVRHSATLFMGEGTPGHDWNGPIRALL